MGRNGMFHIGHKRIIAKKEQGADKDSKIPAAVL